MVREVKTGSEFYEIYLIPSEDILDKIKVEGKKYAVITYEASGDKNRRFGFRNGNSSVNSWYDATRMQGSKAEIWIYNENELLLSIYEVINWY